MNRGAIIIVLAAASVAGAAPAPFDIEADGEIVPVDFSVAGDRTYVVLDRHSNDGTRRFELQTRDAGGELLAASELWNSDDPSWPPPRTARLLAERDGADVFLSGADTWTARVSADGSLGRARIVVAGDLGILHGLVRRGGRTVAVFAWGVVLLDGGMSETARWHANGVVGGFAAEGDALWIVELVHARGGGAAGVLRGLMIDGLAEFESAPLPGSGDLPKVLAWSDEVLVFVAGKEGWRRCSHHPGSPGVRCTVFEPDTRSEFLRFGTMAAQAFRTGDGAYVLAVPEGCGIWARRYNRNHVPTAAQPFTPSDGAVSVVLRESGGELLGMGVRVDLDRGGPRSPATRAEFRSHPLAVTTPAQEPTWAAACPGWNDAKFFVGATAAQVSTCIAAGVDPNAVDACSAGITPLALASLLSDDPGVTRALLDAGADPNSALPYGSTVLHEAAAASRSAEVLSMLIGAGADVDAQDAVGRTPMHRAAESADNPVVLDMLIAAGADTGIRDIEGRLPVDYAQANASLRDSADVLHPGDRP